MAKHELWAAKTSPRNPKDEIRAAPSWYDRTHPVGSAERFLDEAAKEALAAAAARGVITPRQAAIGAVKAVAKEAGKKYPDPLLAEAAKLPKDELLKRAARAEAFRKAMEAQNKAVALASALDSPLGKAATAVAGAELADRLQTQQDAKGGDTPKNVRAAEGGGDAGSGTAVSGMPVSEAPQNPGGPRIVINPTTFRNPKDALCVAFNEGFRLWMETTGFEPRSEPTDAQRKFFSDTAYADDELQLRRTILARIATFDTSVKDPTDDQLAETASFLNAILDSDWCRNEWERNSVGKLAKAVGAAVGAEPAEPRAEPVEPRAEAPLEARAALGGGETYEDTTIEDTANEDTTLDPKPVEAPSGTSAGEDPETENETSDARDALVGGSGEAVRDGPDGTLAENPAGGEAGNPQNPAENPAETAGDGAARPPAPGQEPEQAPAKPDGARSGVWTGGEDGKGRQLTAREAEWMRQRIDSGASVSGRQLAMFGLSRDETGQVVDANGELHKGFGAAETGGTPGPDAGLDRRNGRKTSGLR